MEELGSGFYLAMHDLEIRGAGEVLGENQSGNMLEVGFQLYNEMLSEAVRSLKAGKEPDLLAPLAVTTEINLHAPALLPDEYCGDVHLRLSFYKKLATAKTVDQIDGLLEEIVDRFGKLPPQGQTLIDVHRLRVLARPYGVVKVDAAPGVINIAFRPNPPIDPMNIIQLVQKNGGVLNGSTRFDFTNYFEIVPSHKLETFLWAEADRMRGLAINQENLTNQQGVVKSEVRVNVLNTPYGGFPWLDMPQYANTNWYNARNFYGDLKDLDAATVGDVASFFKTYYAPNNAVLVVVGDFKAADAAAEEFADIVVLHHLRARLLDAKRIAEIDPELIGGLLGLLEHLHVDDGAEADVDFEEVLKADDRQARVVLRIVGGHWRFSSPLARSLRVLREAHPAP